jgi:ElaB/YqjD/DUF883 family membrane-anchored ribosome-binding protein
MRTPFERLASTIAAPQKRGYQRRRSLYAILRNFASAPSILREEPVKSVGIAVVAGVFDHRAGVQHRLGLLRLAVGLLRDPRSSCRRSETLTKCKSDTALEPSVSILKRERETQQDELKQESTLWEQADEIVRENPIPVIFTAIAPSFGGIALFRAPTWNPFAPDP